MIKHYRLASIFDAYYGATTLDQVRGHILVYSDEVFDRVPGRRGLTHGK